jgi:hypothetical protein
MVAEHSEQLVDVQVNRRGLNAVITQWVNDDATLGESLFN